MPGSISFNTAPLASLMTEAEYSMLEPNASGTATSLGMEIYEEREQLVLYAGTWGRQNIRRALKPKGAGGSRRGSVVDDSALEYGEQVRDAVISEMRAHFEPLMEKASLTIADLEAQLMVVGREAGQISQNMKLQLEAERIRFEALQEEYDKLLDEFEAYKDGENQRAGEAAMIEIAKITDYYTRSVIDNGRPLKFEVSPELIAKVRDIVRQRTDAALKDVADDLKLSGPGIPVVSPEPNTPTKRSRRSRGKDVAEEIPVTIKGGLRTSVVPEDLGGGSTLDSTLRLSALGSGGVLSGNANGPAK